MFAPREPFLLVRHPMSSDMDRQFFFERYGVTESDLQRYLAAALSAGCGVRVISGERTGYAHTDDLAPEKILHAARTAALIANGPAKSPVVSLQEKAQASLYPVPVSGSAAEIQPKLDLVFRADRAARGYDPRIVQVRASYADEVRRILVVGSDGTLAEDLQPLSRMSVFCIAKQGSNSSRGTAGGGGRVGIDYFQTERTPDR